MGYYDDLLISVCREQGGFVRNVAGDSYLCTFSEAQNVFAAVEKVCWQWEQITRRYELGLSIAIHQGDVNILRAYVYGKAINEVFLLSTNVSIFYPSIDLSGVLLTQKVASEVQGTKWDQQIQEMDWSQVGDNSSLDFLKTLGAHRFIPNKVANDRK